MSRRVQLRKMTEKEFESYAFYSNEQHAADLQKEKGIGKEEALCEMDEAARQLSCKKCVLFVENENMGARKLYEKSGYIYRNERENGRYMDKDV